MSLMSASLVAYGILLYCIAMYAVSRALTARLRAEADFLDLMQRVEHHMPNWHSNLEDAKRRRRDHVS
jgi:hypothetical protein